MENQQEKASTLNPKNAILLIGAVFGTLISLIAACNVWGFVGGLIIAALFNKFILPQKPSDR